MLAEARASLLPIRQHAEQYSTLARCFRLAIPKGDGPTSRAQDYAEAFETAAEALDGLAHLDAAVGRVRIQNREHRS